MCKRANWPTLLVLFLTGCAQVSAPTGGPVDEDPPQVVSMDPPTGTLRWDGGILRIEFDEYVQLKNVREQWLISPPVDRLPAYRLRGKTLELDWAEVNVDPDATIVLDLGESVVDLHEGNVLRQGIWAATKGNRLDSLRWTGQILHRDFARPAEGIRVMLFPDTWPLDSLLQGARPRYVGVTDAQGRFEVGFIAPGRYRTWAVEDANKDWAWQSGESVGWSDEWQAGDTLPTRMTLFPTFPEERVYASRGIADSSGVMALEWNGPEGLSHLEWSNLRGDSMSWWSDRDSVWLWTQGPPPDSLVWTWKVGDGPAMRDTVVVRTAKTRRSAQPIERPTGKLVAAPSRSLRFLRPIQSVDPVGWQVRVDSTLHAVDSLELVSPFEIRMHWAESSGTTFELEVTPTGIAFAAGEMPTDTLRTKWMTWPEDHLAELVIAVNAPEVDGRLRLEDATGRLLAERELVASDSTVWTVRQLLPGKVELIWESDRQGTGQFAEVDVANQVPGDVRLKAEGGVELRSNWTMEWIWSIDTTKFPKLQ